MSVLDANAFMLVLYLRKAGSACGVHGVDLCGLSKDQQRKARFAAARGDSL